MYTNEEMRLQAVKRFMQFNFDLDKNLQGLLKLASDIYKTPVAFLTLIDEKDQWIKVNYGFQVERMPRNTSFCTHAIMEQDVMVVSDAMTDKRFNNNPLVHNAPNIKFYAGAPLASNEGQNIGTICVMDVDSKEVSDNQKQLLSILAQQAVHLMELELTYKTLSEKMTQVASQNKALMDIAFVQSHEFRGPLSTIMGIMNVIKEENYNSPREYMLMLEEAVGKLDEKIHVVVKSTEIAKMAYVA